MTSGVPQCSVLGPPIWNMVYDGIVNLDLDQQISVVNKSGQMPNSYLARTCS